MAAQHVDMGRHVDQVARIGHQIAQPVAGPERALRERRHLHQVNVEMQQAGMVPRGREILERAFENLDRLGGAGILGDAASAEIPHLPRRLVHDRVGEDRADVEIVTPGLEHRAHRLGEGLVPP